MQRLPTTDQAIAATTATPHTPQTVVVNSPFLSVFQQTGASAQSSVPPTGSATSGTPSTDVLREALSRLDPAASTPASYGQVPAQNLAQQKQHSPLQSQFDQLLQCQLQQHWQQQHQQHLHQQHQFPQQNVHVTSVAGRDFLQQQHAAGASYQYDLKATPTQELQYSPQVSLQQALSSP